jgi:molybdopterin-guanine dinucleotide biosynthesis protein A
MGGASSGGKVHGLGGVVLCGGRSARMGSPKAWLDFGGEALLQRVLRRVAEVAAPVVVVAAPGQDVPPLPAEIAIVRDPVEGRGPLQGIAAGLAALEGRVEAAFVASTDAPFLHPALIHRLAALRGEAYDIAVPRAEGHLHPLAAVYGMRARAAAEALLAADRLRTTLLFEQVRTLVADPALLLADADLAAADPELRSLRNVNTQEAYAAALAELRSRS